MRELAGRTLHLKELHSASPIWCRQLTASRACSTRPSLAALCWGASDLSHELFSPLECLKVAIGLARDFATVQGGAVAPARL